MENKAVKVLISVILVLVAVVSATFVGDAASDPASYERTVQSLDGNSETVLELVAASTLVSAAVSAIPDDTATPIAEKIADFTEYFLFVLVVIFAEKYLLTIIGTAAFRILIPIACLLAIISIFRRSDSLRRIVARLCIVAFSLFIVTPLSVRVSDTIYNTYRTSIDGIISSAEDLTNETADLEKESDSSADGLFGGGLSAFYMRLRDTASHLLNNFVEALAVIIVASCIIPVLSVIFLLWLVKTVTGLDLSYMAAKLLSGRRKPPLPHVPGGSSHSGDGDPAEDQSVMIS